MTDIDIRTAQLIIQLARDDLYGLDNGVDGGLSDLEFALAEQEREFMQFWMDYGDAQVQRSTAAVPAVGAQAGPGGDNATRQAPAFAPPAAPPSPALHDIAPPDSDTDDSEDDLITFPQDHLPPNIQLQHVIPQIGPGVWLENQVDDIPSPPRSPSPVGSDSDGASLPDVVPFLGPIVVEEVVHNWPAYTLTEPPSPVASVAYSIIAESDDDDDVDNRFVDQAALPTIGVRGIRVFREDESDEEEGGQGGQGYVAPEAPPRIRAMNPFDIVVTNVEPQVECVFCKDHFPASFTLRTPCEQAQHHLCRSCVTRNVELCTRDETAYPPKCCTNKLPLRDMLKLMDDARLRATYEVKTVEYATPHRDRVYCCTCADFLGSRTSAASASSAFASIYCYQCSISTCTSCRQASHPLQACRETVGDLALKRLSREKGWQTCPNCDAVVELHVGCYHIKCRCATEFCYLCATKWKTCGCPNADEDRLIL